MTRFTAADGQAIAERLTNEQQAIFERLLDLEDHLGYKLLASAVVEGVTRECRADVLAGFATLWTLYETYRTTVSRVRTIMARRSRPDRAELREVEKLEIGAATVALPSPDGSRGSLLRRQVTLDELVSEIQARYSRVHEVVTAVDQVWAELSTRIDGCDKLLREVGARAAELGLAADQDPAVAALAELADRLGTMRRIALTDPLRLWANDAVDVAEADRLISRCEGVHADLHALGELPQHAQHRLDQVDSTLTEVRRLDQEISVERRRVHAKIHASPAPAPVAQAVQAGAPLGPRLADAAQLCRHGHWRQLGTELPALERDADAALVRARAELAEAGQPLRERAELRGRLSAYRAKAAGLGRIEDLALEQRYQRARDLLWRAPCDLGVAATAVAQYQDAVNTTAADRDTT